MKNGNTMQTCITWLRTIIRPPEQPREDYNQLCSAFLALYGGDTKKAVKVLNQEFGTNYTPKRFTEWRRRQTPAPAVQREFMRVQVVRSRFDIKTAGQLCELLDLQRPGRDLVT